MSLWLSLALSLALSLSLTCTIAQAACYTGSPFASTCQPATVAASSPPGGIRGCFRPDLEPSGDSVGGVSVAWNATTGECVRRPTACGGFTGCAGRCLVSCDVASRGFLALSLRAAAGVKSFTLIDTPAMSNGSVQLMPDVASQLPDVFRANVLDQLPSVVPLLAFKEVVVSLSVANSVAVNVTFDLSLSPEGLSHTNWFSKGRLKASWPVTDLWNRAFNFFSIRGDVSGTLGRSFFINYLYDGCPNDVGFMVALDIADSCPWGSNVTAAPKFMYGTQPSISWTIGQQSADKLSIVLR